MAGHSQFKNIMHRKGAQDAKRAKIFAKHGRELMVAAKSGTDPAMNARLRTAIAAARADNMPKDNIERAVKRGAGDGDESNFLEVRYEGYGIGGIAVLVEALTDNRNRTAADVRSAFTKHAGNLGETGSVGFMFDRVGIVRYAADVASADDMFEAALEAGAENVESADDGHEITCIPESFLDMRDALEKQFGQPLGGGLEWMPQTRIPVDADQARTLLKMIDALEDSDDVQSVSANFDMSDDVLKDLSV